MFWLECEALETITSTGKLQRAMKQRLHKTSNKTKETALVIRRYFSAIWYELTIVHFTLYRLVIWYKHDMNNGLSLKALILHNNSNMNPKISRLPSALSPDFTFRFAIMEDKARVMLGLNGWAPVSITITICAVWSETLWKVSGRAPRLPDLSREGAWPWGSVRQRLALGKAFVGEDSGVEDTDGGLLELSSAWFGKTFFR